jgi:hypothetical protein
MIGKISLALFLFLLLLLLMLIHGCENPAEYTHDPKLTVNAELKAGYPIDSVFVTRSVDITQSYDTKDQLVHQAEVSINGVKLVEYATKPGVYYYPDPRFLVQSGESYRLEVNYQSQTGYSQTTVPRSLRFTALGVSDGDTVQYIPGNTWFSDEFFTLVWPGYDDSRIFRIISLADSAKPRYFIEDDRPEANAFKGEEQDRLNPGIWWAADTYARINWMYFNWTGWHDIIVSAMDNNYYNYRQGILFGEQGGQNFKQVVEGGYGLFCSSASDTLRIFLRE